MRSVAPLAARLTARAPLSSLPTPIRSRASPVSLCAPPSVLCLSTATSSSAGAWEARQQAVFPVRRTGVNSSGAKVERPVSPHVTIYSQPIVAVSSITNRVSGVMLTVGMYGGGLVALSGTCDLPSLVHSFQQSAPALVPVAKALVAWPLVYHTLAGVRHLYWDYTARGMDLSTVELSSKALIGASVALALGAALITLQPLPAKYSRAGTQPTY